MRFRMTWLILALAATINVCLCDGDTHNMDILDTVQMVDSVDMNLVVENYLEKFIYAKMRLRTVY